MTDPYGAFLDTPCRIDGSGPGPLTGLTFAAKDVFDIAGHVTGNGSPDWASTHGRAIVTASTVRTLVDAGASLAGKTVCDEMCYSMVGWNAHYGAPINPAAPDRHTGGSSCGSVAAVAGKLVDFALGTDCGGSVRIPAAFCGVYGIRPTHARISADHVAPLASSFDTVGWFTRDAALLEAIGSVLLPDPEPPFTPTRLLIAEDLFDRLDPSLRPALHAVARRVGQALDLPAEGTVVAPDGTDGWFAAFRLLQAREIWRQHGDWIERHRPSFGPGVAERMQFAATVTDADTAPALELRGEVRARMDHLLSGGSVLCLPTGTLAPERDGDQGAFERSRQANMALTCVAGLSGVPQIHLPLASIDGCPAGISLMAARGRDRSLLGLARVAGESTDGQ
jgi:amidase